MKGEFYKMEYEAWDEGTDALSLELEAAYLRICHQMYRRQGPIPENIKTLARFWRCHPNKANKLLAGLIEAGKVQRIEGGLLTNNRVTQELDTRETISRQRADAGRTGGTRSGVVRANALNGHATAEAVASSKTNEKREEEKREEDNKQNRPDGSASLTLFRSDVDDALGAWNELAKRAGLAQVQKLTDARRRKLLARLKSDGLDGWQRALAKIQTSPFLSGDNDRGWRADFDFLLSENNFAKVMEGKYDRSNHKTGPPKPKTDAYGQIIG